MDNGWGFPLIMSKDLIRKWDIVSVRTTPTVSLMKVSPQKSTKKLGKYALKSPADNDNKENQNTLDAKTIKNLDILKEIDNGNISRAKNKTFFSKFTTNSQ